MKQWFPLVTAAHRAARARWRSLVERGAACCARCGQRIVPGSAWHLDHADDRSGYLGVSHASCNLAAGAAKTNRERAAALRAATGATAPTPVSTTVHTGGPTPWWDGKRWSRHWGTRTFDSRGARVTTAATSRRRRSRRCGRSAAARPPPDPSADGRACRELVAGQSHLLRLRLSLCLKFAC
jgi:hypothetical protein